MAPSIGQLIAERRTQRGWDQKALATTLKLGQQTVSRWEKGTSRPRPHDVEKLAQLFNADISEWLVAAGHETRKPVRPLLAFLPLDRLSPENFELLCRDLVQALNPGADVHRYGQQGHKQDGIDLLAKNKTGRFDYQCKRHKQFGPRDVAEAVAATTFKAKHHHLLLSRKASPAARKAIDKYRHWSLWDQEDISAKIRGLSDDDALRIVDTYFPGHRRDFLGRDEPSPWVTAEVFFQPLASRQKIFSHGWSFFGRDREINALASFVRQNDLDVMVVIGRGGIGKSRLLREWTSHLSSAAKVVFLSPGCEIMPKDFELLPEGQALLVIDDIHERSDLRAIFSGITRFRPDLKVVVTSRPYGLTQLQDELTRAGMRYDPDHTLVVGDLSVQNATDLAREILTEVGGDVRQAERIGDITKDCPLATVIGSKLVGSGEIAPHVLNNSEDFQRELLRSFRDVVAGKLAPGADADAIRDLLDFVAMVQPVDAGDPAFQSAVERLLNVPFGTLSRYLRILEDAGVLLRRGNRLRIVPDLLADFIRAEASYEVKHHRPTGYVDRVFSAVQGELAANLLANISQLDWRLADAGSQPALLSAAWAVLKERFLNARLLERIQMLKMLERVAYYQPEHMLDFVRLAIGHPTDQIEENAWQYLWRPSSYTDVLEHLPPILRYVAYHEEHLPEALDTLKTLAQRDARAANQSPGHPVRVLKDLARIEPGKPLRFNRAVVDHIIPWLDEEDRGRFSPFDVLDQLLITEGHQTESNGRTFTLIPYKVRIDAVAGIRRRIIDAAFAALKRGSLGMRRRSLATLEVALRYPFGVLGQQVTANDREAVEPDILDILRRLEVVVTGPDLDPFLAVEVRMIVAWHATYSTTATKPAARAVLAAIPATPVHELCRAIADPWGRTFENDSGTTSRDLDACIKWRKQLGERLLADQEHSLTSLISVLEERVGMLTNGLSMKDADPLPFVAELAESSLAFGKALGRHLVDNPASPLVNTFSAVVAMLAKQDPVFATRLAREAVETADSRLTRSASWALGWSLRDVPPLPDEIALIRTLAGSDDAITRANIVHAVRRFPPEIKGAALDVLMSIQFADSPGLSDALFSEFAANGTFTLADLSEEHLARLCEQLVRYKSLDEYHTEVFLRNLSFERPDVARQLLIARVEYAVADKADAHYVAVPHMSRGEEPGLRFHETVAYESILRFVRDWMAAHPCDAKRMYLGARLFALISNGFDETTVSVLDEWTASPERQRLDIVASLASEAEPTFVWTHQEFVSRLLRSARNHGQAFYRRVCADLGASVMGGTRMGTAGKPFQEDIAQRDRSYELMSKLPPSSPAYGFYKGLYESAKRSIERDTEEELE